MPALLGRAFVVTGDWPLQFHDIDLAPDAEEIGQYEKNLKHMVALAKERQQATGMKLLWGTANLFSHPRYAAGAATNPDPEVFAYAAAQVAHQLGRHVAGERAQARLHPVNRVADDGDERREPWTARLHHVDVARCGQ